MPKQSPTPAKSGMLGARTVMELHAIAEKRRARDMREIREELIAIRELLPKPVEYSIEVGNGADQTSARQAARSPLPAAAGTAASNTTRGSLFRRLANWWR